MMNISLNFLLYLYLLLTPTFCMDKKKDAYSALHTLEEKPPAFIPNIDFLGIGYNIYYGNPMSTEGLDSGYRNFRIASFTYPEDTPKSLSADRQYFKPEGVRIMTQQSCSTSFSSTTLDSEESYSEKLQASLGLSASFGSGAFSANAEYNQVSQGLVSSSSKYVISSAQCVVFQAGLIKDSSKKAQSGISEEFQWRMKQLAENLDNSVLFHEAFDEIGTHVVEEIKLGSQFGYVYELKTSAVEKHENVGMNLEVQASIMSAKAGVQTEYQKNQLQKFKTCIASWKSISLGVVPDPSNDVGQWATQTITNPIPVQPQLITIDEFVAAFSDADLGLNVSDKDKLVSSLQKHLGTYCKYIKSTNKKVSCSK